MMNTIATVYEAAGEKLDRMSAYMGSADGRMVKRHNALDERINEKLGRLSADLKKSFGHAAESYRGFTDGYSDMRRSFGRTM